MLTDVVGDLLPSALAVALSPIPIIAVVLAPGRAAAPLGAIQRFMAANNAVIMMVVLLLLGAKLLALR